MREHFAGELSRLPRGNNLAQVPGFAWPVDF